MYLQGHVVAQFLVYREHAGVVGVEAVHHRVELDSLDAVLAQAADLAGLVFKLRVDCAEGHQHVVLDADEPVVGPLHLVGPLHYAQDDGLVDAGLAHVGLDALDGVHAYGIEAHVEDHRIEHRAGDPVRPDVGMDIDAHGCLLHGRWCGW